MFHSLWHEPRRSKLRLWIFQTHQWAGVGVGLYLALMGLTGSLSVFLPELRGTLVASIHPTPGANRIPLQALQDRLEAANPGIRLRAVFPAGSPSQPGIFQGQTNDKSVREFVLDPYTGKALAVRKMGGTFYDWVRDLHANLLSGKTGKAINGFGGIVLFLTSMTGLVIWWPGKRNLNARSFQVATRKGLPRLSYDLHRLAGFLLLVPISAAALTGIALAFPQLAGSVISTALGPLSETPAPGPVVAKGVSPKSAKTSLDDVIRIAQQAVPGATPVRILPPGRKTAGFVVSMHLPTDWRDEGDNRVIVDASSPRLLAVQIGRNQTLSSRTVEAMGAVHFGQYGGVTTRILACLFGASLPFLYLTGMVMWWKRVMAQRNRAMTPVAASGSNVGEELHAAATQ